MGSAAVPEPVAEATNEECFQFTYEKNENEEFFSGTSELPKAISRMSSFDPCDRIVYFDIECFCNYFLVGVNKRRYTLETFKRNKESMKKMQNQATLVKNQIMPVGYNTGKYSSKVKVLSKCLSTVYP